MGTPRRQACAKLEPRTGRLGLRHFYCHDTNRLRRQVQRAGLDSDYGRKLGTYPLSATFEEISASATITVPFGNPTSIVIEEPAELSVSLPPYPMIAAAMYSHGGVESGRNIADRVTWSIDDPSIASIGADGVVRASSPAPPWSAQPTPASPSLRSR